MPEADVSIARQAGLGDTRVMIVP